MNSIELRNKRRQLAEGNKLASATLADVPSDGWPRFRKIVPFRVLRSKRFLVQIFAEAHGAMRMSIVRTELDSEGRWKDGITWDDLQTIKRECGYGERDAVELFPADSDLVNVANMRHLWILDSPPPWKWKRLDDAGHAGDDRGAD